MNYHRNNPYCRRAGILFIALIFGTARYTDAQTVLLHIDRSTDSLASKHGPNLHSYIFPFLKFGWVAGTDAKGARIKYGSSVDMALGMRKKYKAGSVYSAGWDIQLNYQAFKLRQDSGKIVPNNILNKTERIDFSSLRIGLFNRFNFDPGRGNIIGKYMDIGVTAEWCYVVKNITKNDLPDGSYVKAEAKNQPYYTDLNAYGDIRIGTNRIALYGTYRFTDVFRPRFNFPELPRINIGLELSLGN